jgi:hypothetical protein
MEKLVDFVTEVGFGKSLSFGGEFKGGEKKLETFGTTRLSGKFSEKGKIREKF